jgi:hypothetical protein
MDWRAHRWAKAELKKLKPEIKAERKRIQSMRKMSDRELFKTILRRRSLKGMLAEIKANI